MSDDPPPQGGHHITPGMPDSWGDVESVKGMPIGTPVQRAMLKSLTGELPSCEAFGFLLNGFCRARKDQNGDRLVTVQIGEWVGAVPYGELLGLKRRLELL